LKKLSILVTAACTIIIVVFLALPEFERVVLDQLNGPKKLWTYAVLSATFLASDIFLPIPSSPIMILNGRMLGLTFGSVVSLIGGVTSSLIGFQIGRGSKVIVQRWFNHEDIKKSNELISKWGNSAIVISRALPILAEAVAIVAGSGSMTIKRFFVFSVTGQLLISLTYAFIGTVKMGVNSSILTILVIFGLISISWILHLFVSNTQKQ
jgi:membrane protein DedA with SNARE-associated domain